MSIRRTLVLGLLMALTVLLAVSGTLLYIYMNTVLARQFDAALVAEADAICSLIKLQPNGEVEVDLPQEPITQLGAAARPQYFQIWRADGTVLVRSPALGVDDLPHAAAADTPVFANMDLPQGRPGKVLLLRFVPAAEEEDVADGRTPKGPTAQPADQRVIVAVAQDRSELKRIMAVLFSALLAVAAFMVIGTVAVVNVVVRRGLSPLQRLAHETAHIDAQSLDFRFSLDGIASELQPICLRLNDSLERLQKAFQRERRFTADVAHELRTPIAELRCLADVALKWQDDPASSATFFKDAQDIARQMETLVTTMLALARSQSGSMGICPESVAVGDLLEDTWRLYKQRASERKLAVSFQIPGSLVLETDRFLLRSILDNLLSNAVEYTPCGGSVACQAEPDGAAVRLCVTNGNDTLTQDDLPHMFEAFWRKDAARTDSAHSGLGLTVAATYAALLGGTVAANLEKPQSLSIILDLPWKSDVTEAGR